MILNNFSLSQNLAEAEYAVALFMYMRLQGYPPDKIAILTTYNGQKHLIRDVLQKRCARNPVFGLPEKVCIIQVQQQANHCKGTPLLYKLLLMLSLEMRWLLVITLVGACMWACHFLINCLERHVGSSFVVICYS